MSYASQFNACMAIFTAFPGQGTPLLKFTYNDDGTATVVLNNKSFSGTVIIPEVVSYEGKNYVVTHMGNMAGYPNYTKLVIADTVKTISGNAISSQQRVTEITFGKGITSFPARLFYDNLRLKKINYNCIYAVGNSLGYRFADTVTEIIIGDEVQNIPTYFTSGTRVASLKIPASVINIESFAFSSSNYLTTIEIDKPEGSIPGYPWGAPNATVIWNG